MKFKLILAYIATFLLVIVSTPYFMIMGVIDAWQTMFEEYKRWHKLYWRATDERAD